MRNCVEVLAWIVGSSSTIAPLSALTLTIETLYRRALPSLSRWAEGTFQTSLLRWRSVMRCAETVTQSERMKASTTLIGVNNP
jgi:hypothetical protein